MAQIIGRENCLRQSTMVDKVRRRLIDNRRYKGSSWEGAMPGASERTRPVKVLNANWVAGADGADGRFEVMIVTDDDERHTVAPSPASMTVLLALAKAGTILLWDPTNRTLIGANVVGTWLTSTGVARATVAVGDR
jgi:hypothetical protein